MFYQVGSICFEIDILYSGARVEGVSTGTFSTAEECQLRCQVLVGSLPTFPFLNIGKLCVFRP